MERISRSIWKNLGGVDRDEARRILVRFGVMVIGLSAILMIPGCFVSESRRVRNAEAGGGGSEYAGGPLGLRMESGLKSEDENNGPGGPKIEFVDVREDPGGGGLVAGRDRAAGESKIAKFVDEAFDFLMKGEAAKAVGMLTEAQTVPNWAQSPRAASVLYWLGQSYERLNERSAAMASYRKMLRLYPDSAWSRRARKRLTALEGGGIAVSDGEGGDHEEVASE